MSGFFLAPIDVSRVIAGEGHFGVFRLELASRCWPDFNFFPPNAFLFSLLFVVSFLLAFKINCPTPFGFVFYRQLKLPSVQLPFRVVWFRLGKGRFAISGFGGLGYSVRRYLSMPLSKGKRCQFGLVVPFALRLIRFYNSAYFCCKFKRSGCTSASGAAMLSGCFCLFMFGRFRYSAACTDLACCLFFFSQLVGRIFFNFDMAGSTPGRALFAEVHLIK